MVQPVGRKSEIDFQDHEIRQPLPACSYRSTLYSIEQIRKHSFAKRLILSPILILSFFWKKLKFFVVGKLLCCESCKDPINWMQTKTIFEKIYNVIVRTNGHSAKDQRARFKEALEKLSDDALARFKFHIGICIAATVGGSWSESEKAKWYRENENIINFREDYFESRLRSNDVLKNAVQSFWEEIQKHT